MNSLPIVNRNPFLTICLALSVAAALSHSTAHATSNIWDGDTDGTWATATNWAGDVNVPGATIGIANGDTATFNNNVQTTITVDANRNVRSFSFETAAGSFTIGSAGVNGGNALLLSSGGQISMPAGGTTLTGTNLTMTFNAPIVLEPATATTAGSYNFTSSASSTNILKFAGDISGGTTTQGITLQLNGINANAGNEISGAISDGGATGGVYLKKVNAANWTISGTNNSFTGGLEIDQGTLNVATISNTGTNSSIGAGGGIFSFGSSSNNNTINVNGAGGTTDRTISFNNSSGGQNHLIIASNATGANFVTLTGSVTNFGLNTTAAQLELSGGNVNANAISGNITDKDATHTVLLTKTGSGVWILSGTGNNYTGSTAIGNNGGVLAGIGAHAFGSTSGINIGSGTLSLRGDTSTSFTKASDSTSYSVTTTANGATINVDEATAAGASAKTMTIGTVALNSAISNGTIFTGANNTSLMVGAVTTGNSASGTETITNNISGGGSLTLASVSVQRTGTPTLVFDGSGNTTVSGAITETAPTKLIYSGGGILALNGNSGYTGTTAVSAGVLQVNGTHTGGAAYSVTGAGTLAGSGTITTAGNAGVSVSAGAKLSPGASPGTSPGTLTLDLGTGALNIAGAATAANSQSMLFDLVTPGTSDQILLSNPSSSLNIGIGVLEFDDFAFTTGGGFSGGIFTLFNTGNAITGSLGANLTGTVGGFAATLGFSGDGQDVILTVVPEPGTWASVCLGSSLLLGIQKRRRRI